MRTLIRTMLMVAAATLAVGGTAFGFADFYFIRDPYNANQLQAHVATSYDDVIPDPHETGDDSDDSEVETDEAEAVAGLNDDHLLSTATAQTAIVPYGGTGMSVSGEIQTQLLVEGEDDLFEGTVGGALGIDDGTYHLLDPLDSCQYYGIVASDVYSTGHSCTISGTVTMGWGYSGDADLLDLAESRGGTIYVHVGTTLVAKIDGGPGSAWLVSGPYDMGHSEDTNETSDSVSVNFSVSAQVGSRVTVTFVLEDIFEEALEVDDFIQDDIVFEVDISVS